MKSTKQKKITKDFFNQVSGEWFGRTYDPAGKYLTFPGNKIRMEVALEEISRLGIKGRALDIGCGEGQLVIELLKKGINAEGIDIAEDMIKGAKDNLKKSKVRKNPDEVFRSIDLDRFKVSKQYDIATGLGLLEYLDTDKEFFSMVAPVVHNGGYVLAECRNKFFNLFSANQYTVKLKNELPELIKELNDSIKYSPVPPKKIPMTQLAVSSGISKFLSVAVKNREWLSNSVPHYTNYPPKMVRRQHTPQEIEASAKKYDFKLEYVVYWHPHPYPPVYGKNFPRIFNKISHLMNPLGRTPLGAWMCSSFIAVFRKR